MVDFSRNGEARLALLSALATGIFGFLTAFPFLSGMDGPAGGFALAFLALLLGLTSVAVFFLYAYRAWRLEQLFTSPIVHWAYDEAFWKAWVKDEFREESGEKLGLLMLIGFICVVVGVPFILVNPDSGALVTAVLFGLMALLAVAAYLVPLLTRNKRLQSRGEAFIGKNGLWLCGDFHNWEPSPIFRFESARIRSGRPSVLVFEYAALARYGYQQQVVRVPIPNGKMEEAEKAARRF